MKISHNSLLRLMLESASKYFVKDVDVYSDAGILEGSGGVVFRDGNDPYGKNAKYFEFRIDNE